MEDCLKIFKSIDSEWWQALYSSFWSHPSEVALLLNSNLSRLPFLRLVVDLDLLLCTGFYSEYVALFLCHIFYSETNDWSKDWVKIWLLLWPATTSRYWVANSIENFFSHENKKWLVDAWNLQCIKTFLTLGLSQYRKSGSMVSSSKPVATRSDCHWLENALCLCSPVRPAKAVQQRSPKSSAIDFAR